MSTSERIDKAAKEYMYFLIKCGWDNFFNGDEVLEYNDGAPFTKEEKDEIHNRIGQLVASVTP